MIAMCCLETKIPESVAKKNSKIYIFKIFKIQYFENSTMQPIKRGQAVT